MSSVATGYPICFAPSKFADVLEVAIGRVEVGEVVEVEGEVEGEKVVVDIETSFGGGWPSSIRLRNS